MSIANFGMIPYGHTLMANVKFLKDNDKGCDTFGSTIKTDKEQSPIVVVRRGDCSFVQKVRNVEHGGGKVAIVVDEVDNENPANIIMVDDGTGNGIQIPSIMISKTDGETLINKYTELTSQNTTIIMAITFEVNKPSDTVEYDIWFSSSNDRGLDFVSQFKPYHELIASKVVMTPRYFTWDWSNCDDSITSTDCFCDGKYCAMDETNLRVTGRDIILENLRQKWVYSIAKKNKNEKIWWEYVKLAHSKCYKDISVDWSKLVHSDLKLDYTATENWVNSSFDNADHGTGNNKVLSDEVDAWNAHGSHYIPSVIINSVAYRGTLDPENVFSAICNSFKDVQEECKAYVEAQMEGNTSKVTFNWFIIVIIFLILLNIALLLIWKRIHQRSMKQEVTAVVNEYMKIRQDGVELSDK